MKLEMVGEKKERSKRVSNITMRIHFDREEGQMYMYKCSKARQRLFGRDGISQDAVGNYKEDEATTTN